MCWLRNLIRFYRDELIRSENQRLGRRGDFVLFDSINEPLKPDLVRSSEAWRTSSM